METKGSKWNTWCTRFWSTRILEAVCTSRYLDVRERRQDDNILTFVILPWASSKGALTSIYFLSWLLWAGSDTWNRAPQSYSEFPPETRRDWHVETWHIRGGVINRPNTKHALPRKAIQVEQRCPRVWRPRFLRPSLWQDVGTSNRFRRCGLILFSCVTPSCV